jgi:hypothetical protein
VARIVGRIRQTWPKVRIVLRGDSGFANDVLMAWCEANGVDYVFGLARNPRLEAAIAAQLAVAKLLHSGSGHRARVPRLPLSNPGQLEPRAARGRQDRV